MAGFGIDSFGLSVFGGVGTADLTEDWQFELGDYRFGVGSPITVADWNPTGGDVRHQDQPAVRADSRIFGVDRYTPGEWTFELSILRRTPADALADLGPLREAWDSPARLVAQEVAALRYRLGGRTRRVFGRPRRFTPVMSELVFGRVYVAADFSLADTSSYDDFEQSVSLTTGPADLSGTGVSFPVTFPVLWGGEAGDPSTGSLMVGGTRSTWLTVMVTGPVTDPYVIVGGSTFQMRGVVRSGEAVVLSSVPWSQGIFRSDGSQAPVTLDHAARLENLRVSPGAHSVTFGGIDNTGSATCTVAWRDAYTSI